MGYLFRLSACFDCCLIEVSAIRFHDGGLAMLSAFLPVYRFCIDKACGRQDFNRGQGRVCNTAGNRRDYKRPRRGRFTPWRCLSACSGRSPETLACDEKGGIGDCRQQQRTKNGRETAYSRIVLAIG
uniref:hypothetical protein n=1 Tax=Chromobacterium violaceum TaxID=536 RepID=UPI00155DC1E7|nr:hypothetical protein [Chromobacterium violaceum]